MKNPAWPLEKLGLTAPEVLILVILMFGKWKEGPWCLCSSKCFSCFGTDQGTITGLAITQLFFDKVKSVLRIENQNAFTSRVSRKPTFRGSVLCIKMCEVLTWQQSVLEAKSLDVLVLHWRTPCTIWTFRNLCSIYTECHACNGMAYFSSASGVTILIWP